MTDDIESGTDAAPVPATDGGRPKATVADRPQRGLAGEQLRAAAKVIESVVGKAQARARAISAEGARVDG